MIIVLSAKSLDDLCQSSLCQYHGPFATPEAAQDFCGLYSADCGEGRDGRHYWIVGLTPPANG